MFHLQSLELLQWDYCQRLILPLDGSIITVAGPNGSGKTTLLDAMRTLLGLDCSGGRNYKTYARHANANSTWLRATVDNRQHGRQSSSRPFARNLLYSDVVTLACRIERNGGDWQRRYQMTEGDVQIETLIQSPDKEWLGIEHWRKRLEGAGLSRAIARVLALEQGQTDRLCEYSPKELLRLVFDVFGDQEVLDRYEEARGHQRDLAIEMENAAKELAYGQAQLSQLEAKVNNFREYRVKVQEREVLSTEVVPVLTWYEDRQDVSAKLHELHRQRLHHAAQKQHRKEAKAQLLDLLDKKQAANQLTNELARQKGVAHTDFQAARDAERPVEEVVKHAKELTELAAVESDSAQLADLINRLQDRKSALQNEWTRLTQDRQKAQGALDELLDRRHPPVPRDVDQFLQELRKEKIGHHVMANVIDIVNDIWRAAAEGVLRGARWVVVLHARNDEAKAMALAERARYRHYLVSDAIDAPSKAPEHSLLAVLKFSDRAPVWLIRQLEQIRRVSTTQEGIKHGGEWITPEAYLRDPRGGRSVWLPPGDHQFGAAALTARRTSIEQRLADLDRDLTKVGKEQLENDRQLVAARKAGEGHRAAEELANRSDEFAQARERLPPLSNARAAAGSRWQKLDMEHGHAVTALANAETNYTSAQTSLAQSETEAERHEREWDTKVQIQRVRSASSRDQKRKFPPRWIEPRKLVTLQEKWTNAKQASLWLLNVETSLEQGQWEKDATVEERHTLMQATVGDQTNRLEQCKASNASAATAVSNARERYIDVLRATVRRYRKNIVDLGELAGVEVSADLPHLENDDTILRQAELKVSFNFDGKGQIGLNDGEASGGQQVIKSLILLVGLLKDDESSGGFVFIDEPFAHLDVRNIQLVGHFLKSTRAQYVLTTPITHNVEVFEPADITLVTSKKQRDARWAPPIGVLQRRTTVSN